MKNLPNTICTLGWLAALNLAGLANAAPELPVIPPSVFNITHYGAVGDGVTTNTDAITAAVNAINAAGGGTLEVPPGRFLSGPFVIGSSTRVQLDAGATLLLLPYGVYPHSGRPPNFITVQDGAHDIEFCGPGLLDGQGAPWWAAKLDEAHRPYEIHMENCHRVFIHDWNSRNPPMKHIVIDGASDCITVQNVTNIAPYPSPNTDGINVQGTHCLIQNSVFSGGDDNIAIGRSSGPAADVLITNVTCGTGHGISLGSITSRGISNVTVVDCSLTGTDFGLRLKAGRDRGGLVQNITYRNISMTNVVNALSIYSFYKEKGPNRVTPEIAAGYKALPVIERTPVWRNISFSNVTATGSTVAGIIWGRAEMLVSNVTLDHVNISAERSFGIYNARGIHLIDSIFTVEKGSGLALYNAEVEIRNSAPTGKTVSVDGLSTGNSLALDHAQVTMTSSDALGANPINLAASRLTDRRSLALQDSTVLNFALGSNASDLTVKGDLTFNGIVNISDGGGFQAGEYKLFVCDGTFSGQPRIGTTPAGYHCTFDTSSPGQGKLLVSKDP